MKKISVIIPIFNSQMYLAGCIESVLAQTYKNIEIILIDDGSSDNSSQICDDYAANNDNITVVHKENQGVSAARNTGLEIATGDYIGFIDADDRAEPEMFEALFNLTQKNNVKVAICSYFDNDPNATPRKDNDITEIFDFSDVMREILLPSNANFMIGGYVWNKLFSRDLLFGDNKIKFRDDIAYAEDMLFVMQCLGKSKSVAVTSKSYYNYNVHEDGATRKFKKSSLTIFKSLDVIISIVPSNIKPYVKAVIENFTAKFIVDAYKVKDKESLNYLKKQFGQYKKEFNMLKSLFSSKHKLRMKIVRMTYRILN